MSRSRRLLSAICLSVLVTYTASEAAAAAPLDLPRRQHRLTLDGDPSDWTGPALRVALRDTAVPAPLGNAAEFRLVWDTDYLWFLAEVEDAEVYAPPPTAEGATIYQWDSIELYIDGRGDRSARMDENDTQLIVSCDGRTGAMQGDELLRSVDVWDVPKRERRGLAVRAAARLTPTGYTVEGAFPFSAVDLSEARAGRTIALDLAWNDWIEDHPRLPELLKDLENLALLKHYATEDSVEIVDPDSLGWHGLLEWEDRAYRPHSWCNGPDFGHPPSWCLATLTGRPPLAEALVARWGLAPLLGGGFGILLAVALAVDLRLRARYRRRLRELMARIEALSAPPPAADPRDWVARVDDRLADSPKESDAVGRVLAHVRAHLGEPLSVADLASGAGVSQRTLQRICREELGAPPRDVILAVKMRSAREDLATGRYRVHEVADRVGFDSPYHFSRRFKDFHGRPPSDVLPKG